MTTININNIFADNTELGSSISGVNNRMKVEGQRRVCALWKRLSSIADGKCDEMNQIVDKYSVTTKTEEWPDTRILKELGRLAHLLGYLTYLGIEKWFSAKGLKDDIHECKKLSHKFNHVFEKIIEALETKNNILTKRFLDEFLIDEDSDVFEVWWNWIKWDDVESQVGEHPQDRVAFIESLMVCKKGREY